jgi:cytochrome c553
MKGEIGMKKRRCFYLTAVVVMTLMSICCWCLPAAAQENMTSVDNSDFGRPERTPSIFRHDAHNEKAKIDACNTCHHVYKNGKLVDNESSEDRRCADCHDLKAVGKTPSLRRAFHLRCVGCHEKAGRGPIMCGECHKK